MVTDTEIKYTVFGDWRVYNIFTFQEVKDSVIIEEASKILKEALLSGRRSYRSGEYFVYPHTIRNKKTYLVRRIYKYYVESLHEKYSQHANGFPILTFHFKDKTIQGWLSYGNENRRYYFSIMTEPEDVSGMKAYKYSDVEYITAPSQQRIMKTVPVTDSNDNIFM